MKKYCFFFFFFICKLSFSQGIIWETNIKDAFKKAKMLNKNVFVECYLTTCPICQSFEPILKSKDVGDFYNKNFINFKLNGAIAEQVKFLNEKRIWLPSFPMLLFFDANGNVIHQTDAGVPKSMSFINLGETALNPKRRASSYQERYESGERELSFLINYAYYSRCLLDTAKCINISNSVFESYPKEELNTETSWAITKKIVMDVDNGFALHWLNNVNLAKEYELKSGHVDGEKNVLGQIIQTSIYSPKGWSYSSSKINLIKDYMTRIGFSEFIEGATWQHEVKALIREGQVNKGIEIIKNIAQKNKSNGPTLIYISSFFIDNFENVDLKYPLDWLNQSKNLIKENNYLSEYYFQFARLYKKQGEFLKAKESIKEAKKYGILAKINITKLEAFEKSL